MNHYALYYFTRAVSSRPKDSRMYIFLLYFIKIRWNALATCFERIDKKNEAIKCFEKSESCKDKECNLLYYIILYYIILYYIILLTK